MTVNDVRDLWAYMQTLPAVAEPSKPHDVPFPFDLRRSLGGWKLLFVDGKAFAPDPTKERGLEPRRLSRGGSRPLCRMSQPPEPDRRYQVW